MEMVLSGHDHDYERFAPQNGAGAVDVNNGVREFVVGTGGASLRPLNPALPISEARQATAFGVLKLILGREFRMGVHSHSGTDRHRPRIRHLPLSVANELAPRTPMPGKPTSKWTTMKRTRSAFPGDATFPRGPNRRLLLASFVGMLLLIPLWLDPPTLGELRVVIPPSNKRGRSVARPAMRP